MSFKNWSEKFFPEESRKSVIQAVETAEKSTSGEILPVVVHQSAPYSHVFLALLVIFAVLGHGLLLGAHEIFGTTVNLFWETGSLAVAIGLAWAWRGTPLAIRWLTPSEDLEFSVQSRAELEFFRNGLKKTDGSTGILLFLSYAEHRAVVLADEGISKKLPPETWQEVVKTLIGGVKKGGAAEGIRESVELCGKILKDPFPRKPNDTNEIPNRLIVKE